MIIITVCAIISTICLILISFNTETIISNFSEQLADLRNKEQGSWKILERIEEKFKNK